MAEFLNAIELTSATFGMGAAELAKTNAELCAITSKFSAGLRGFGFLRVRPVHNHWSAPNSAPGRCCFPTLLCGGAYGCRRSGELIMEHILFPAQASKPALG